ncbi:MAG: threonine/serine exporter family protein [Firmicutes bacterium]|nr:threonine/serine exporter family protein [Alicyclobacillaceae bacterium]MCL6497666.1 threonine/serine exporter family protein [Bacillota bacterium]
MEAPWEALEVAAEAGALLIQCGAEVERAEETAVRVARAYGWTAAEAVAMPTALFVSAPGAPGAVRRIRRRGVNLAAMAAINQLSRDLEMAVPDLASFRQELRAAAAARAAPPWVTVLVAAWITGWMSQLLGGSGGDFLPAAASGMLAQVAYAEAARRGLSAALANLLAASLATVPPLVAASGGGGGHPATELVAGITVLVPGLALTTAVRDAIAGDLLAAAGRFLEAVLVVAAVAAGVSLVLAIGGHLGGRWP